MKRAFKNLKSRLEDTVSLQYPGASKYPQYKPQESTETMTSVDDPRIFPERQEDMMLYRKHRGVNLGSWFVLERWITESPYREAAGPGQSDLDVAKHWDTWVTEKDWSWIAGVGINAVRIPVSVYYRRSEGDGLTFTFLDWLLSRLWCRPKHSGRNGLLSLLQRLRGRLEAYHKGHTRSQ
jgi:hypothetical protein